MSGGVGKGGSVERKGDRVMGSGHKIREQIDALVLRSSLGARAGRERANIPFRRNTGRTLIAVMLRKETVQRSAF